MLQSLERAAGRRVANCATGGKSAIHNPQSTIVFIHGAGSSSDFWHWQRQAFPNGYYPDLPGHGRSLESMRSSVEEYAYSVKSYIESAGLRNVVLNGHSMGGAITLVLALQRPEWLRGIILTGTGARLRVAPHLLELLRSDYPAAIEAILEASFDLPQRAVNYAQKVRLNGTRRQLLRTPQEVTLADYEACGRFDVMERVNEIGVPTLCIVGRQDKMTPVKYSEYLHSAIEGSQLEVIEGAGHMLPIEKSEEYNRKVVAFLVGED